MNDGAVFFSRGTTTTIETALTAVLSGLGYTRTRAESDLEIATTTGLRAMCFTAELTAAHALAFAKRFASKLAAPVRVMTAHLIMGKNDSFSCDVRDLTVTAAGAANPGPWAEALEREYVHRWDDVCDGKAYFAVSALMTNARETALPDGAHGGSMWFAAPSSLGSARLDEIARQVRFAERARFTEMGGRDAIQITSAGATITSFVEPRELELLRTALDSLLTGP